jgi:hypothetical protein
VKNPRIAQYAEMSDFAKIFVADYLVVHASDELLGRALAYGEAADTLPNRNAVRNGESTIEAAFEEIPLDKRLDSWHQWRGGCDA